MDNPAIREIELEEQLTIRPELNDDPFAVEVEE